MAKSVVGKTDFIYQGPYPFCSCTEGDEGIPGTVES